MAERPPQTLLDPTSLLVVRLHSGNATATRKSPGNSRPAFLPGIPANEQGKQRMLAAITAGATLDGMFLGERLVNGACSSFDQTLTDDHVAAIGAGVAYAVRTLDARSLRRLMAAANASIILECDFHSSWRGAVAPETREIGMLLACREMLEQAMALFLLVEAARYPVIRAETLQQVTAHAFGLDAWQMENVVGFMEAQGLIREFALATSDKLRQFYRITEAGRQVLDMISPAVPYRAAA